MKKLLLILISSILLIGASAFLYFSVLKENIVVEGYTGQKLSYLGESKVLRGYPKEFVQQQKERLNAAINFLATEDPKSVDHWLDIGLVKKTFNNYEGARDVWEHAKTINSDHPIAYANLAKLYGFYLNDLEKAEKNYQEALDLDPNADYLYLGLAELYRDAMNLKKDLVDDVLLAGLKHLPGHASLMTELATFYQNNGEAEKAIYYYNRLLNHPYINDQQKEAIRKEIQILRG